MMTLTVSNVFYSFVFVLFICCNVVENQFQPPGIGFGSQPVTIRECLRQQSLTVLLELMTRFNYDYILDGTTSRSTVLALSNGVLQAKIDQLNNNNTAIQEFVSSLIISQYMTVQALVQATLNNVTILTLANTRVIARNYTTSATINGGVVLLEQICGNGIVIVLSDVYVIRQGTILSNLQTLGSGTGFGIFGQLIRSILSLPRLRDLFGSDNAGLTFVIPRIRDLIRILLNPRLLLNYIFNQTLFPADFLLSNNVTSLTSTVFPIATDSLNQLLRIGPDTCLISGPSSATTGGLIYFGMPCSQGGILGNIFRHQFN